MEEFVLRLVDSGVNTGQSIRDFLGLPMSLVTQTIADHFSSDYLTYASGPRGADDGGRRLALTPRGRIAAKELASIAPVQDELDLVYDELLCKIGPFRRNETISQSRAKDDGLLMLPRLRKQRLGPSDISPSEINALLRDRGDSKREILMVKGVSQRRGRRFLPVQVLLYSDSERSDIQIGVVVDGEISNDHELSLIESGGADALGIKVDAPEQRPQLDPILERDRIPLHEVTRKLREEVARQATPGPALKEADAGDVTPEREIRAVAVYEHPELLSEALLKAKKRILIISPWVKNAIVDTEFIRKLEMCLKRKVDVRIAYGIRKDGDDSDSDAHALKRLANLEKRYPEQLSLVRVKSTHAKILIFDDVWINTSFNWLSFRGSRDRTYRMEEGTLVRGNDIVDAQFGSYVGQIENNRL
ncbi:phospholipase D-like domain-containing protein [Nocardiopsis alborubida]|uniref:Phospholipase D-like domain-containing protein n=1 Tax=Nocardiopsis alborubida TaxID=146802 RepID=A0A7X6MEK9_9ACTN|nr:phospholipase D-like domain-containing protein [Nocardiopsis alborubida]NKZ00099.1 hypothetical protein [Nocardiopsis alborubida]